MRLLSVLVIAAHPGDAFFAMGAPVAVATHLKGEGYFLSLSLGERGSPQFRLSSTDILNRKRPRRLRRCSVRRLCFFTIQTAKML